MLKIIKSISLRDQPVIIATPQIAACSQDENEIVEPNEPSEAEILLSQTKEQCEKQLEEAQQKADQIIADATAEAEKLKDDARTQGEKEGRESGYQAGFSEGKTAGDQQIHEELKQTISDAAMEASRILKAAQDDSQFMIIAAERDIVNIAIMTARKVLDREIDENPMVVLPIVKAALDKVKDQQEVTVRVNSADFELVMQSRHDLQALIGREQPILVQADDSVSMGSCLIDTTSGTVDARIDTQFEAIKQALGEVTP